MSRIRLAALPLFLAASTCLLASPALRPPVGNVLIVDASGGGHYSSIQSAVDAALEGDVLLVMAGTYTSFLISNKALTVVGDAGARVLVDGAIRLHDLAAQKTVVLAGLEPTGRTSTDEELSTGIFLADNQGQVRIENCTIRGGDGPTGNAVTIRSSADVAVVACTLVGGLGPYTPIPWPAPSRGGKGLEATGSSMVTVYGSSVRGNDGLSGGCGMSGGWGGDGGNLNAAFLFCARSSFLGGRGGDAGPGSVFSPPSAGSGGDGIRATSAAVYVLDCQTIGGPGGQSTEDPNCGSFAYDGYTGLDRRGSTFTDVTGTARTLVSPTPVIAGTSEYVTVRGQPGDRVALFVAASTAPAQYVPAWHGVLLVSLRSAPVAQPALVLGTVPGSGVIEFLLETPALAPGEPSRTVFLQALFLDTQGQRFLSGARSMTILP